MKCKVLTSSRNYSKLMHFMQNFIQTVIVFVKLLLLGKKRCRANRLTCFESLRSLSLIASWAAIRRARPDRSREEL